MSLPWIMKYIPRSSNEFFGHSSELLLIKNLVSSWKRGSKPVWIYGPSGVGKTAVAYALANDFNLELMEVNASDSRNAASIDSLIGGAVNQGSLFGRRKLILIDEIDGLSGTKDRGGIPALVKIVKNSSFPVIITGQDPFDKKFSSLRKACELVAFNPLPSSVIESALLRILNAESVSFNPSDVKKIALNVDGDLRAAINDVQSNVVDGSLRIDDSLLALRDHSEVIERALLRVFKTTDASFARGSFDMVSEDINEIMLWVDYNLPLEYSRIVDLQRAFDALSLADVFLGRIKRWQHYRFYVYAYDLLTAGIALAKDEKYKHRVSYSRSKRLLQIWMANQKNAKKNAIAEKVAVKTHCSVNRALDFIPFLQQIAVNDKSSFERIASFFDFNIEEKAWLSK